MSRRDKSMSLASIQSTISLSSGTDNDLDRFFELNNIVETLHKGRWHKTCYAFLPCVVFVLFLTSSLLFGYYLSYKRELNDQEKLFATAFNGAANGVVENVLRSFSLAKDVGF